MNCNETNNRISTVNVFSISSIIRYIASRKQTLNSQKLIPCRVMCDVVNLEFFNDKLATTGSAWKIFYFPCHAYLTYSNCDSLSCWKTGPQCTALLKFICAFTRFVNVEVVWSRTVLFIRWTYWAKFNTFLSKFFKEVVIFWEGLNKWQTSST